MVGGLRYKMNGFEDPMTRRAIHVPVRFVRSSLIFMPGDNLFDPVIQGIIGQSMYPTYTGDTHKSILLSIWFR